MVYEAESGDLTLVASGDTMITRRLSVFREPQFVSLVELFRQADVGYTNLEMLMHEYEHADDDKKRRNGLYPLKNKLDHGEPML